MEVGSWDRIRYARANLSLHSRSGSRGRNPGFDWKLEPKIHRGLKNRNGDKGRMGPIEPGTYKIAVYAN
jgi:hypothetical protein